MDNMQLNLLRLLFSSALCMGVTATYAEAVEQTSPQPVMKVAQAGEKTVGGQVLDETGQPVHLLSSHLPVPLSSPVGVMSAPPLPRR